MQGKFLEAMNFNGRIQDNIYYVCLSDFSVKVFVCCDTILWLILWFLNQTVIKKL